MRKLLSIWLLLTLLIPFVGCAGEIAQTTTDPRPPAVLPGDADPLAVTVLDVGQGDSVFIALPDGKTVLIDASEAEYADRIIAYIREQGYDTLDYVVATHPHADHIGGMSAVLSAFSVGEIWMPDAPSTTQTYEKLLRTVEEKNIPLHVAKAGKTIVSAEGLEISLLGPMADKYSDLNHYSAIVSLIYGQTRFLFMGDAEGINESELLGSGIDLSADVLKLGHHGSNTSSTEAFVRAVNPIWGVISCGEGNKYGHPNQETLALFAKLSIPLCRTDQEGHLRFYSDGQEITRPGIDTPDRPAVTEPPIPSPYHWILNTSSKKIHREGCASADKIADGHRAESDRPLSELADLGYTPCGICKPTD